MLPVICLDAYFQHSNLNLHAKWRRKTLCDAVSPRNFLSVDWFQIRFSSFDSVLSRGANCESASVPAQKALTFDSALLRVDATSWNKESAFAPLPRNIVKRRPSKHVTRDRLDYFWADSSITIAGISDLIFSQEISIIIRFLWSICCDHCRTYVK